MNKVEVTAAVLCAAAAGRCGGAGSRRNRKEELRPVERAAAILKELEEKCADADGKLRQMARRHGASR
ncbi:uncharacterized protein A4U43_C01F2930 [Asparagus officinalis]|uniref:Uncharacterized protein n=1 Tax=Asparagus officinalis TaxID=4686 RepID=A0A5P1FQ30_ASPOF|nr:uncharacterized protein A4U43_C01F2930 [Asparagus officinalis]